MIGYYKSTHPLRVVNTVGGSVTWVIAGPPIRTSSDNVPIIQAQASVARGQYHLRRSVAVIAGPLTRTSSDNVPIRDRLLQAHASVGCGKYYGGERGVCDSGSPDPHVPRRRADRRSAITASVAGGEYHRRKLKHRRCERRLQLLPPSSSSPRPTDTLRSLEAHDMV